MVLSLEFTSVVKNKCHLMSYRPDQTCMTSDGHGSRGQGPLNGIHQVTVSGDASQTGLRAIISIRGKLLVMVVKLVYTVGETQAIVINVHM